MLRILSVLIWFLVKLFLSVLFYATPLIGFWLASSLAAYLGGPPWMAWAAGALLFPIIPGLWEFFASSRRRSDKKPLLTTLDRLSLRTFGIGLAFLAALISFYPQTAFIALSTRGDWMLAGIKDARADRAREILFTAAGGLEWLYDATRSNPYKSLIDPKARQVAEEAAKQLEQESPEKSEAKADLLDALLFRPPPIAQHDRPVEDETEAAEQKKQETDRQREQMTTAQGINPDLIWPWKGHALHHAVATMPASAEKTIESVAQYIAGAESDPVLRIKALHDYVADRVAYDSDSYYAGRYPPQDAQTVFETRKSVCAGYANLLTALADSINEKIVVVVGDARSMSSGDRLSGSGHAWNAASINDRWYLIDACWDAGSVSREKGFTKRYKTDYLLIPPRVMIEDHFPEEAAWQLLARPLSQGEFLRQPMLRPRFRTANLILLTPDRAQNETGSSAVAIVKNPDRQWLMGELEESGKQVGPKSKTTNSQTARLEFPLPDRGTYRLNMFVNEKSEYGRYDFVGSVDFVRR